MQRKYDYIMKIVLIGSTAVGKSALLKRFSDNQFNEYYISTIGVDFRFKSLSISQEFVKLQIWDTAGQERFKGITKSYYNKADAVIIVYDVDESSSFSDIKNMWLKQVKMYCKADTLIFAFANKCDVFSKGVKEKQKKYFISQGIKFYETSAKVGRNVQQSFTDVAKILMKKLPKCNQKSMMLTLQQSHFQRQEKQGCCK